MGLAVHKMKFGKGDLVTCEHCSHTLLIGTHLLLGAGSTIVPAKHPVFSMCISFIGTYFLPVEI